MHGHTRCKHGHPLCFVGPCTGFRQSEAQPCLLVPISAFKIRPSKVGLEPAHSDTKKAAHSNRKCGPILGAKIRPQNGYTGPTVRQLIGECPNGTQNGNQKRYPSLGPESDQKIVVFPVPVPVPQPSFLATDMVPMIASKTTPLSRRNRVGIAGPLLSVPPSPALYHPWP